MTSISIMSARVCITGHHRMLELIRIFVISCVNFLIFVDEEMVRAENKVEQPTNCKIYYIFLLPPVYRSEGRRKDNLFYVYTYEKRT